MCGRYAIMDDNEIEEINKIIRDVAAKCSETDITAKTGEIFPTNNAPILSLIENKPSLSVMKWGFPKWDGKGVVINARSETAAEKTMFAKSFFERRCVVPSTGFYEWAKSGGKTKDKYLFNTDNSPMLYMAGVYSDYPKHAQSESLTERFVILTRASNASISDIHDRMPVILYKDELVRWLTDNKFAEFAVNRDSVELVREKSVAGI